MLFFTILVATLTAYIFSNYAGFSLGIIPPTCQSNITDNLTIPAHPYGNSHAYPLFDNLGFTLVKTFSLFVGELEFSDIPFNSPFSYFFFLAFVFLIVVVLMNLLNGLAVSDTGLIREEAEIHAHVSRVEVISQAEATLLGDPAHLLRGMLCL